MSAYDNVVAATEQLATQYQEVVAQAQELAAQLAQQLADVDARIEQLQVVDVPEDVTAAVAVINDTLTMVAACLPPNDAAANGNPPRCPNCNIFIAKDKPCKRCGSVLAETPVDDDDIKNVLEFVEPAEETAVDPDDAPAVATDVETAVDPDKALAWLYEAGDSDLDDGSTTIELPFEFEDDDDPNLLPVDDAVGEWASGDDPMNEDWLANDFSD